MVGQISASWRSKNRFENLKKHHIFNEALGKTSQRKEDFELHKRMNKAIAGSKKRMVAKIYTSHVGFRSGPL